MNPLAIFEFGSTLLDKFFPDAGEAAKAKLKLMEMQQTGELTKLQTRAGIITAEANSDHFLVAAWRPITMLVFVVAFQGAIRLHETYKERQGYVWIDRVEGHWVLRENK